MWCGGAGNGDDSGGDGIKMREVVVMVVVKKVVDIGAVVVVMEIVVGESSRESSRCYCYGSDGSEDSGSVRDDESDECSGR